MIKVTVELDDREALALAQFCKRSCYSDFELRAVSVRETNEMIGAILRVKKALADRGYSPR